MNFNTILHIILGSVLLLAPGCDTEDKPLNVDVEIEGLMQEYGLPSISSCIVGKDGIIWENAYGYSDRENQLLATTGSVYHVASLSKLVIATAIMQQVEMGRLDIDTDINQYIPVSIRNPHFPDIPITARMLLTHTSGLAWPLEYAEAREIWDHFQPDKAPPPSEWIPQFLVPGGEFYNPLIWKNTKPGSSELYSNIGCNVLAYLIEQLSGQEFREYCKARIFQPVGMDRTSYDLADVSGFDLAVMYDHNNSIHPPYEDRIYSSGGLRSSANDFASFLRVYLNDGMAGNTRILEKGSIDQLLTLHNDITGTCLIWNKDFGEWYNHTGGLLSGAATTAEINLDFDLGIVIFCNRHKSVVFPGHEIHRLVREKAFEVN